MILRRILAVCAALAILLSPHAAAPDPTRDGKIAIKGSAERIPGKRVGFVLYAYDRPGAGKLRMVVWDIASGSPAPRRRSGRRSSGEV
jgi:hypothetical protein